MKKLLPILLIVLTALVLTACDSVSSTEETCNGVTKITTTYVTDGHVGTEVVYTDADGNILDPEEGRAAFGDTQDIGVTPPADDDPETLEQAASSAHLAEPGTTAAPEESPDPDTADMPDPTETPRPAETPGPTETPDPAETPAPTETPRPTETPGPTETPRPAETPESTAIAAAGGFPAEETFAVEPDDEAPGFEELTAALIFVNETPDTITGIYITESGSADRGDNLLGSGNVLKVGFVTDRSAVLTYSADAPLSAVIVTADGLEHDCGSLDLSAAGDPENAAVTFTVINGTYTVSAA